MALTKATQYLKVDIIEFCSKQNEEVMPLIVLHPSSSKASAQYVLDTVYRLFPEEGLDVTPRYNEKITSLIYVAQGNGDDKADHPEFYEPGKVYYKKDFETLY